MNMNTTRFHRPTRLLALLLSVVMIAGMLPKVALPATAVGTDQALDAAKVADPGTANDWKISLAPIS